MDLESARQGRRHHRRQRRHRARRRQGPRRRGCAHRASPRATPTGSTRRRAEVAGRARRAGAVAVACDVATAEGCAAAGRRGREGVRRRRHPDQQCRHRQQRDDHGGARREVAVLLGPARDGGGPAGARPGAGDAPARRRRHPQQRLDLRRAAALVRADLQRHQGGAGDVLQDAGDRVHQGQHPGQRDQCRASC